MNLAAKRVLERVRQALDERGTSDVLVVGGGRQRSWLDPILVGPMKHRILYSDIDVSADVAIICDGHDLPFKDASFDAVITTAVIEHVLYPERVAMEITRVLKEGGLLYSEVPFMQQVHEGAYDFTRYSLSGHRRLFNSLKEVESGMVAGPATALVWAIESLALSFCTRRRTRIVAKAIIRVLFAWLKHLDRFIRARPAAMDGASCTYLLARKDAQGMPDEEIIARYVGGQVMRHV